MGADLSASNVVSTAYAASVIGMITSIMSGIVAAVAADRNFGIFYEIHTRRVIDFPYWLSISVMPILLSLFTSAVSIISVFVLSDGILPITLTNLGKIIVAAMLIGFCLGIFASGIGVSLPDPYLGANIVGIFLPVFTGVITPINLTPQWVQEIALLIPAQSIIQAVHGDAKITEFLFLYEIGISLFWAFAGILCVRIAVFRIRSGLRQSVL